MARSAWRAAGCGRAHLEDLVLQDLLARREARRERAEIGCWRTVCGRATLVAGKSLAQRWGEPDLPALAGARGSCRILIEDALCRELPAV